MFTFIIAGSMISAGDAALELGEHALERVGVVERHDAASGRSSPSG